MAGALKQTFIEAVRLTPDGIVDFLATPLPAAPTISTPADADAAILASGILSKYLLDLFATFEGLTPIELLLRIGQHNSVLESAMLAGLEYIEGADSAENDITVLEPQDGVSYTPGEMRFIAKVANGFCIGMTLTLGADPIKMVSTDDVFTQFVNMEVGDYTATFDASFEDTTTQTASVHFTVAEYDPENPPEPPPETPPLPPGGQDRAALDKAISNFEAAYKRMGDLISDHTGKDALYDGYSTLDQTAWIVATLVKQKNPPEYTELAERLADELSALEDVIDTESYDLIITGIAPISTTVHEIAGLF
jgi:hypothetical protein